MPAKRCSKTTPNLIKVHNSLCIKYAISRSITKNSTIARPQLLKNAMPDSYTYYFTYGNVYEEIHCHLLTGSIKHYAAEYHIPRSISKYFANIPSRRTERWFAICQKSSEDSSFPPIINWSERVLDVFLACRALKSRCFIVMM